MRLPGHPPLPGHIGYRDLLFVLDAPGMIGFEVFDVTGRVVARYASRVFGEGLGEVTLKTSESNNGRSLPAGVYVVRMSIDGVLWNNSIRHAVLLK